MLLGISQNTSLTKLIIRLNGISKYLFIYLDSCLNSPLEDIVFTDRSEELCSALETFFSKSTSIKEMELGNLRFSDRLIDSIGKGLQVNKFLKVLNLRGNSMDWKDLPGLCESLTSNTTLECLDLQNNRICRIRDMKSVKGFDLGSTVQYIKAAFKYIKQIKTLEKFEINEWLFDHLEYPDSVADMVKEARSILSEKLAFNTISSQRGGPVIKSALQK